MLFTHVTNYAPSHRDIDREKGVAHTMTYSTKGYQLFCITASHSSWTLLCPSQSAQKKECVLISYYLTNVKNIYSLQTCRKNCKDRHTFRQILCTRDISALNSSLLLHLWHFQAMCSPQWKTYMVTVYFEVCFQKCFTEKHLSSASGHEVAKKQKLCCFLLKVWRSHWTRLELLAKQ